MDAWWGVIYDARASTHCMRLTFMSRKGARVLTAKLLSIDGPCCSKITRLSSNTPALLTRRSTGTPLARTLCAASYTSLACLRSHWVWVWVGVSVIVCNVRAGVVWPLAAALESDRVCARSRVIWGYFEEQLCVCVFAHRQVPANDSTESTKARFPIITRTWTTAAHWKRLSRPMR